MCLSLLPFAAVNAEVAVDRDQKNDVEYWDWNTGATTFGRWKADIEQVHVRHTREKVIITTHHWRLRKGQYPADRPFDWVHNEIRTNNGRFRFDKYLDSKADSGVRANSKPKIRCRGKTKINYADDVVRTSIPRSCLGNPKWVKVNAEFWMSIPNMPNCCYSSAHDATGFTGKARRGPRP